MGKDGSRKSSSRQFNYSVNMAMATARTPDKSRPLGALLPTAPARMIVPFVFPFESMANPASPRVPKFCTPCFKVANPTAVGLDWNTVYTFFRKALPTRKDDVSESYRGAVQMETHQSMSGPGRMCQESVVIQMRDRE